MAYASLAQVDHNTVSHESAFEVQAQPPSPSPSRSPILPEISSPLLSLPFDHLSGNGGHSTVSQAGPSSMDAASLLKSLSSSQSYQRVEDGDYEKTSPEFQKQRVKMKGSSQDIFRSEDAPIRTASISRHLPLNHPTPDLHSLQGALVKNVERLEESAERLSMTSSLEDELNKLKQDQKRLEQQSSPSTTEENALRPGVQRQLSTGSWSNSIIRVNQTARAGGYSPSGYITSPTGSIRSGPWSPPEHVERQSSTGSLCSHPLPKPSSQGRPLELGAVHQASISIYPEDQAAHYVASPRVSNDSPPQDRPTTSASDDNQHQAQSAFNDFDGVHYGEGMSGDRAASISRQISLRQPPLARDSKAYREPQPGERMIYYPAPVPVMLNLPQRLSKFNTTERDKRLLQGLSGIPADLRKSAPWLTEQDSARPSVHGNGLKLPPQLRASAFFEQPSVTANLQLKNGSAVQTLDSILDASTYAPVSAFTDHPIVGQLGKEVYGPNALPRKSVQLNDGIPRKRRSSIGTMLKTRRSSTGLSASGLMSSKSQASQNLDVEDQTGGDELDVAIAQSISPDADEIGDEEEADDVAPTALYAAPTTLLAELQMRKEQQKTRNRSAADAFPNGMHSTLLELDAVTQVQQKARKTKHVTLAWEDHDDADRQNFDDEDVPLGVLFPAKNGADHVTVNRSVGLLEKRQLEDNEPLSHRRARLRGEPRLPARSEIRSRAGEESRAPFTSDVPALSQVPLAEEEEETLAQRAARMKFEKEKGTGGQFAEEMAPNLGLNVKNDASPLSKTPDIEETLAQRRQRLKEEAASNPQLRSMHGMADILQAHPIGLREQPRQLIPTMNSNQAYKPTYIANWESAKQNAASNPSYSYPANIPYMNGRLGAPLPTYMQQTYPYIYGNQPYIVDPMMGPPLDPKQRAQIDRWRQSVVQ